MLVEMSNKRILIDLGVTASMLRAALEANGYCFDSIDAVLVTHTHSDHVKGLDVCMKRIAAPIYMSQTSKDQLMLDRATALVYDVRTEILAGLWVTAIRSSHDCPGSIGFIIETDDARLGYLTDLGFVPESTMDLLYGADGIVIESNHDEEMLRYGKYPVFLKKRILSERGHLSNDDSAGLACTLASRGTRTLVLGHLSRENNTPELARLAVRTALDRNGYVDVELYIAPVSGALSVEI